MEEDDQNSTQPLPLAEEREPYSHLKDLSRLVIIK